MALSSENSRTLHRLSFTAVGILSLLATATTPTFVFAKEMGDMMMGTPSAPRNPRITMNIPGRITVSWDASETGTVQNYVVYRTEGSDMDFASQSPVIWTPGTQLFYDDYSVAENKKYNYKIAALNGSLESSNSPMVSATQEASIFVINGHHNSPTSLHVSWSALQDIAGYDVYRAPSGGTFTKIYSSTNTIQSYYDDTGLSDGATYTYYVTARKNDGTTRSTAYLALSTPVLPPAPTTINIPPPAAVPGPVTGLSASITSLTSIRLNWTAVSGASAYTVHRRAPDGSSYAIVGKVTSPSFADSGLTAGTTYTYYVRAENAQGESGQSSAEVSVSPGATLTAPTLTGKLTSMYSGELSWNAIPGAAAYRLYRRVGNDGAQAVLVKETEQTTHSEYLAIPDRSYKYFVAAISADKNVGPSSNEVQLIGSNYIPPSNISYSLQNGMTIKAGNLFFFRYSVKSNYMDKKNQRLYSGPLRIERYITNPKGALVSRTNATFTVTPGTTMTLSPTVFTGANWVKGEYKIHVSIYAQGEGGRLVDTGIFKFIVQ